MDKKYISNYLERQAKLTMSLPHQQIEDLIRIFESAWQEDRNIFVCGNGGSAANASHFITDLSKGASDKMSKPFRGLSLNDNVPWMTALGNDSSYEDIFVKQLINFARPGDLFMVMSVSGNSPNLIKAVSWANDHDLQTIALVSKRASALDDLASFVIKVGDEHYGRVEDAHMSICHILCYAFMENN